MNTPVVSYADVILGGSSTYDWEFRSGTAPVERTFTVTRERADALLPRLGKHATLKVVGPRQTLEVERIYLLEIQPGDDPFTARIRLADRRWLWPKRWVATSFNVRLTTGDKFLAGEGRIENKLIQPDIAYARYSLRGEGVPWKATEALQFVIGQMQTPVIFESLPPDVELQDVIVDDSGPGAIDRVLAYFPGADLYIDAKGNAVVYDRFSGTEREVLDRLPPRQRDGAWVEIVDRRATRPARVVVLFTVEAEVRFEHEEPLDGATAQVEDEPVLSQVAPLPDVSLTIDGQDLARGTWVELSKLWAAWGAFGFYDKPISFAEMRKHALKYGWAQFEHAWGNNPTKAPNPVMMARAGVSANAWRRFLKIDKFWRQRLASIRPYRVSIINVETGAYAPAAVYCDWIRRPSYRGFAHPADQNTNQGWAVRGYPPSGLLPDGHVAPVRVNVVDEDAGIISLTPQLDPYGLSQAMVLGYPVDGKMPSQDVSMANRTGEEVYARWDRVRLEPSWKAAVLLTVVPAAPNDIRRFYAVEVGPQDMTTDPGPCQGPTVYVRVFPGVLTARFWWADDRAEAIKGAIKGEGQPVGGSAGIDAVLEEQDGELEIVTRGTWPSDLLVNADQVRDVALATAARIYDTLRDRPLGGGTVDMRPGLMPTGTISGVRHSMVGGEMVSSLGFPAVTQPADIWRYLNASTRKAIMRVLHMPPNGG